MDVVSRVTNYPVPGETIKSKGTEFHYGGKGANQAVAAARAGGHVTMIGAVGTDAFGTDIMKSMQLQGVNMSGVSVKPGSTGMAYILVNDAGQNQIVLTEGANGLLLAEDISQASFDKAQVVVLQNEIPWETNLSVMKQAKALEKKVIFNPAPAVRIPEDVLPLIGTLVLNESEAEYLSGRPVESKEDAVQAARDFIDGGVREVIVTLGSQGSLYMDNAGSRIFTPAFPVQAVDTTSAGDTFIGCYVACICSGKPVETALRYASAAAAIAVTRHGAQASIPSLEEVEAFLR